MATATTRYPGSSVVTETSAPGYYGGDDGLLNFFNEMARRRVQRGSGSGRRPSSLGKRTVRVRMPSAGEGSNRARLAQERLLNAQASKAKAEAQAISGRAPMRTSVVGGQMVVTPDANAMTGAQRQVHLPGSAGMEAGGLSPADALRLQTGSAFGQGPVIGGGEGGFKTVYGAQGLEDEYSPGADPEYQAFVQWQAQQRAAQQRAAQGGR